MHTAHSLCGWKYLACSSSTCNTLHSLLCPRSSSGASICTFVLVKQVNWVYILWAWLYLSLSLYIYIHIYNLYYIYTHTHTHTHTHNLYNIYVYIVGLVVWLLHAAALSALQQIAQLTLSEALVSICTGVPVSTSVFVLLYQQSKKLRCKTWA